MRAEPLGDRVEGVAGVVEHLAGPAHGVDGVEEPHGTHRDSWPQPGLKVRRTRSLRRRSRTLSVWPAVNEYSAPCWRGCRTAAREPEHDRHHGRGRAGGSMNLLRRRVGQLAIVGVLLGMVAAVTAPRLEGVGAVEAPTEPTPVETSSPATAAASTVVDTTPVTAAVTTDASATTMATTAPTTTGEPAPTTEAERPNVPAAGPLAVDDTYGVTVEAVCLDGVTPAVNVTSTGTGDIRVAVGPESTVLTAALPTWQAPWPLTDEGKPDVIAKWDAVRLDTMEVFDLGTLDLPADCPPPPPPSPVPGPPEKVTSTPGDGTVTLLWQPPLWPGTSEITGYRVEQRQVDPDIEDPWAEIHFGDAATTSKFVTGLTNGFTYMFRIRAENANGPGEWVEAKDTPHTVPSAVGSLVASATNLSGQVQLTWAAPYDGGRPITDYLIERSLDGTTGWTPVDDGLDDVGTAFTVSGLTDGTRYYFRVFAVNDSGTGAAGNVASAQSRARIPTAPRSLTAAPTNETGEIHLSWLAPLSNGGSLTDYVIQRSPNGSTGWTTIGDGVNTFTGYTVTGLTNGTRYYFRVFAANGAGTSPASNIANSVPRAPRRGPAHSTAAPTNLSGQVRLTWVVPLSTGGSAITDYVVQRSPNGSTGWVTVNDGVNTTALHGHGSDERHPLLLQGLRTERRQDRPGEHARQLDPAARS